MIWCFLRAMINCEWRRRHLWFVIIIDPIIPHSKTFNYNRESPAPLSLCFTSGSDVKNDTNWCPTERKILKEFYDSTKGREWTDSKNWLAEYSNFCSWYGISCDASNSTIEIKLHGNGLSGKILPNIGQLSSLQVLVLSDNDIKVCFVVYFATLQCSTESYF